MTMTNEKIRYPEKIAQEKLREYEIDLSKPIDLDYFADLLNIRIVYKPIKRGILGACKAEGLNRLHVLKPNLSK